MKKSVLLIGLIVLFTIINFELIAQNKKSKNIAKKNASLYGIGEANERVAYEIKRLHDPSTGKIPDNIRTKELQFAATLPHIEDGSRSISWISRGPNNQGGRTRAIALDITNENIILTASVTGGIFRSTNGGTTYTQCLTPAQLKSATCLAQDTRSGKTNIWYCGTGEFYGINSMGSFSNLASGNGIYRSIDNGVSWSLIPSTVSNTPTTHLTPGNFDVVWDVVSDHNQPTQDVILAAVYGGIYRSADGGSTWTAVLGLDSTGGYPEYVDVKQTPSGIFYAALSSTCTDKGIWRSIDGITWTNITPAGFPTNYDRIELAYAPSDETKIYMIANTPGTGSNNHQLWHYQYISGTGSGSGGTWQNRTAQLPDEHCTGFYTFDFAYYSSQSGYDMCISVHPTDPNFVLLGGTNIYRSTDGFTSDTYKWIGGYQCDTAKPSNYVWVNHHPDQHQMLFKLSDPKVVYSANDGGIHKTIDITADIPLWQNISGNNRSTQFYTVAIEPGTTSSDVIVGGLQDNGTLFTNSMDAAKPWNHVFYGDGAYCAITHNLNNYYLSWQGGKTFKFTILSNGIVSGLSRIDPTGGSGYQFINPFILDPIDDNVMYLCAGRNMWRNDSLEAIPITGNEYNTISQGWKKLNNSSTGFGVNAPQISCATMSAANNQLLYYGTDRTQIYAIDTARSNTCPKRSITSSSMPANANVSSISADPKNANDVLCSFSNYGIQSIFHSTDAGLNWVNVAGNLEENPDGSGNGPSVNWIHIYHDDDTLFYLAGTSTGLYSTPTLQGSATVWTQESPSLIGNVSVDMIASRPYDGLVVCATHGNGVYSMRLKDVTGIQNNVLYEDDLASVYPNPMAESAIITIFCESFQHVSVEVQSIDGKQIKQLLSNESLGAGYHNISWDGRDNAGQQCAAGLYLIQCSTDKGKYKILKVIKP